MNPNAPFLWLSLFFAGQLLSAQSPPPDLLGENLFPPELILRFQTEIELSDDQRQAIVEKMQTEQPRFEEMQQALQKAVEKLGESLKKEQVEEKATLAQFDQVLNGERQIKSAHLQLMIGLKNRLTPKQQATLRDLKKVHAAELAGAAKVAPGLPPAIPAKLEKVKAGVEQWQTDGRDPSPIGEMMQQFEPLMKAGKFKEAEALLDRALKQLKDEEKK